MPLAAFAAALALPRRPTARAPAQGPPRRAPPACRRAPRVQRARPRRAKAAAPAKAVSPAAWRTPPGAAAPPARKAVAEPGYGPCLVLNADFQPLSLLPLSLLSWQESIKAVYSNRVSVVATYPSTFVRSPNAIFPLPSVICLKKYQKTSTHTPAFSRFNVFLRDGFACQYCAQRLASHELTFDHVVPRCLGGRTSWTNVVAACQSCNHKKGRSLLGNIRDMRLRRAPVQPTNAELQARARAFPPNILHESWRDYLYWNEAMQLGDDLPPTGA